MKPEQLALCYGSLIRYLLERTVDYPMRDEYQIVLRLYPELITFGPPVGIPYEPEFDESTLEVFQKIQTDTRGKGHYRFVSRPNSAKRELAIGTVICGLSMDHVTIECSASDYTHPRTQAWIRDTIITHLAPDAALVIVVLPRVERAIP